MTRRSGTTAKRPGKMESGEEGRRIGEGVGDLGVGREGVEVHLGFLRPVPAATATRTSVATGRAGMGIYSRDIRRSRMALSIFWAIRSGHSFSR